MIWIESARQSDQPIRLDDLLPVRHEVLIDGEVETALHDKVARMVKVAAADLLRRRFGPRRDAHTGARYHAAGRDLHGEPIRLKEPVERHAVSLTDLAKRGGCYVG